MSQALRIHPLDDVDAIDRATRYLRSTQGADGTWSVASALVSTEPTDGMDYVDRY